MRSRISLMRRSSASAVMPYCFSNAAAIARVLGEPTSPE